eukprot:COSAG02_NODE_1218_length_13814_cov_250.988844_14_plen_74_part_01
MAVQTRWQHSSRVLGADDGWFDPDHPSLHQPRCAGVDDLARYIAECTYSMRIMVAHCRVAAALAAVQLLVMQGI